jgi:transcriptional regulator with PAS, ATPase and Fis domain
LFFLQKFNKEYNLDRKISAVEIKKLQNYSFPGNVRELKNSIKRSMIMTEENNLHSIVDSTAPALPHSNRSSRLIDPDGHGAATKGRDFNQIISAIERQVLTEALHNYPTIRSLASHLGMTSSQAYRKLVKHQLKHLLKVKKDE